MQTTQGFYSIDKQDKASMAPLSPAETQPTLSRVHMSHSLLPPSKSPFKHIQETTHL